MITVNIWLPRQGSPKGHASLNLGVGNPQTDVYISYWPNRAGMTSTERVFCAPAFRDRTYDQDVQGEDGRPPDRLVRLSRLNESAIRSWWSGIRRNYPEWCTLSNNCSTTVARALQAGGGDGWCSIPDRLWNTWMLAWEPRGVLEYALAIQRGISWGTP
jgi:hypothetical protein